MKRHPTTWLSGVWTWLVKRWVDRFLVEDTKIALLGSTSHLDTGETFPQDCSLHGPRSTHLQYAQLCCISTMLYIITWIDVGVLSVQSWNLFFPNWGKNELRPLPVLKMFLFHHTHISNSTPMLGAFISAQRNYVMHELLI